MKNIMILNKQLINKSLFRIILNLILTFVFFFRTNLQLNQCFDIFEKSYLSISLSRLSDPVNLMFSNTTTKLLPTQQELDNFIKVIIK